VPITRLVCTSSSPLFHRQMRLWEEVTDERGDKFASNSAAPRGTKRPTLQNAIWLSSSTRAPKAIRCFSKQITATTRNRAARLSQLLPGNACRIQSDAGSRAAGLAVLRQSRCNRPRYDLTLVAGELLKAERGTVTAGAEENLSPKPSLLAKH
jgi:hypothetical protein